ncbi:hypothetical protein FGG08_006116 [Glutinoglossum americanum]|uniref:Arginosuccinase n=1 Tax=Glutinoglossum americanum TaxID=1670608 RepID=A0A9P8I1M4_9PEZI|nr:hypothetical protein FGG08_006116 [Glutinoglossum americanum]
MAYVSKAKRVLGAAGIKAGAILGWPVTKEAGGGRPPQREGAFVRACGRGPPAAIRASSLVPYDAFSRARSGPTHSVISLVYQVATDLRLWLHDELREIGKYLVDLLSVTAERAENDVDYIMPGYTHPQRGQPIRWSHWLLSYGAAFLTDLERLREVIKRVNRSPLGCGALAGNAFSIDRIAMAKELGSESLLSNSMAAVGYRDFILEAMQWGSTLMPHISRWSEDLIIYGSTEFGFSRLADAYTTGSSSMPQEKNSDSLKLLRGRCGRLFGGMTGLMVTIKGLPSTYNKDLQESVEPILEHVKTLKDSRVVALAEKEAKPMDKLSLSGFQSVDGRFGEDVLAVFDYERSVEMKSALGGTSKPAVREQIGFLRRELAKGRGGLID